MIIDDPPPKPRSKSAAPSTRTQKVREDILKQNRETRRAKLTRRTTKLSNPIFDFSDHVPRAPSPPLDHKRNCKSLRED